MTVYLFDRWKKVRRIIPPGGVKKLIHDEGAYTLEAEITLDIPISPGEHLGFLCVDGRFRLFEVSNANENDAHHVWEIKATDAIIVELKGIIREDMQLIDLSLTDALRMLLPETWQITGSDPDRLEKSHAYYATVWGMITTYEALYEWRIVPHYEFSDGRITGRVIELMEDKPVFRGRILRSNQDAKKLYVKNARRPVTALYGLGPSQGTQDVQTNLTFADVEWSVANGDPVDKPKGQAWVGLPDAEIMYPEYMAVISITDAEDADDLLQKTWDNLQELKKPSVNVEAFVTDVLYEPGMSGKEIRIGDLVAVKAKSGQTVEAKIIDVKRDYINEDLTEIKAGDKTETITRQVSDLIKSATHTFERLTVYQNRFVENENLIMLNADHIQLNADHIRQTADDIQLLAKEIELKASHEEVTEVRSELTTVQINVDALEKEIELLATTETIEDIRKTINTVQADLDAAEASILLKASQSTVDEIGERLSTAEIDINAAEAAILLKASQSDMNDVSLRLSAAEGTITAQAQEIYLKADKTYVEALYARTVKTDELESGVLEVLSYADIPHITAIGISTQDLNLTNWLNARSASVDELYVGDHYYENHSHAVTVNEDGTITLGEVAIEGGSFNIADTAYYKDGVSAAYADGASDRWNVTSVYFPANAPLYTYNPDTKQYTVTAYAAWFDGANPAGTKPGTYTFPATAAYEAGYQAALESVWIDAAISSITNVAANTMYASGYARAYSGETLLSSVNISKSQEFPGLGQ